MREAGACKIDIGELIFDAVIESEKRVLNSVCGEDVTIESCGHQFACIDQLR